MQLEPLGTYYYFAPQGVDFVRFILPSGSPVLISGRPEFVCSAGLAGVALPKPVEQGASKVPGGTEHCSLAGRMLFFQAARRNIATRIPGQFGR